jgi:hypothetical protein
MELSLWRGRWTFFGALNHARPLSEGEGDFDALIEALASKKLGPQKTYNKASARYFLPTQLQKAPLTGRTRQFAEKYGLPLIDKQRSAGHVTEASMIATDLDGVSKVDLKVFLRNLHAADISFLAFSSYSHGNPSKKGVRARVVVPVDEALGPEEYHTAACGLNSKFFDGRADITGTKLHQAQGVWATNPIWQDKAFQIIGRSGVASSVELIAAVLKQPESAEYKGLLSCKLDLYEPELVLDEGRVKAALHWIDPNDYEKWLNFAYYLKAAFGERAFDIWFAWGNGADPDVLDGNHGQNSPEVVWERIDPRLPPNIGVASLYLRAKQEALEAVVSATSQSELTTKAEDALQYLKTYHYAFYKTQFEVV